MRTRSPPGRVCRCSPSGPRGSAADRRGKTGPTLTSGKGKAGGEVSTAGIAFGDNDPVSIRPGRAEETRGRRDSGRSLNGGEHEMLTRTPHEAQSSASTRTGGVLMTGRRSTRHSSRAQSEQVGAIGWCRGPNRGRRRDEDETHLTGSGSGSNGRCDAVGQLERDELGRVARRLKPGAGGVEHQSIGDEHSRRSSPGVARGSCR